MTASKSSPLRVVVYPDPVLKQVSAAVTQFGPKLRSLTERMFDLMREGKGVGLAAPQVGVSIRVFVCNPTEDPKNDLVCINPKLLELTGQAEQQEGCLSIPGVTVSLRRATRAKLEAFDLEGNRFEVEGADLLARIWQHEVDHLDGRLIIDRMAEADELANRKALKQLKADYAPRRRT